MDKKYEQAKQAGLNWQALLIEDTQTELKVKIKDMVLRGASFLQVNNMVAEVVKKLLSELENEELKLSTQIAMFSFATRVYQYLRNTYLGISYLILASLVAVANNKATPTQTTQVKRFLDKTNIDKGISFEPPASAYEKAQPLQLYAKEYMKRVNERMDKLATFEAKEDYTSRVNLRNLAEIQIRAERHEQELNDLKEKGVKLVWIVPHANCSERCQKFQGKLYSLDHTSGEKDGIKYEPLEVATDVYETTKSGKVYKNGCISGFNCFDKETEVLTNKGWKLFKDLNASDLIYTLNRDTRVSEWQKPINYFKAKYNGKMVSLKSYTSDLLVTPNHNMLYSTERNKTLRFKEAKDTSLNDIQYAGQEWNENQRSEVVIDGKRIDAKLFCRLLGYWLADGSIHDNYSIKIAQQNNNEMWESLQKLPFKLWRDKDKIIVRNKALRELLQPLGHCDTKYVFKWVKELPKECLQEFLKAFIFTDGYKTKATEINGYFRKPHKEVFTTSKQMSADLCEIALKCGYRPKEELRQSKGQEIQFKNGKYSLNYELYVIHLNRYTNFRYKQICEVDYNDYVYCVEVPNHTLLVKRNGYIQWCGNCRHTLREYHDKNRPVPIPAKVVEKEREINNKQRYFERNIRQWRERALLNKEDKAQYNYSKDKAKLWNERYIEYSKRNKVAYYPSRTEIL